MAGKPGFKAVIKIGNGKNVLTDVTAWTTQAALRRAKEQIEASVLGEGDKEFVSGQRSFVVPFSGNWHPTPDAVFNDDLDDDKDERNFEFSPEGTATGKIKYTGKVNLSQYDIDSSNSGLSTFSCSAQGTGAITRGTHT